MAWLLLPTQHDTQVGVDTNDVRQIIPGAWLYFDHPVEGSQKREGPGRRTYWSLKDPNACILQSKDATVDRAFRKAVTVMMPAEQVLAAFNRAEAEVLALAAVIKETP